MKNKKGFTLVELLAVIVILAILLAIAIPAVTKYITKSRKDGMLTTAQELADAVRKDSISEMYDLPISNSDITIVSIDLVNIENSKKKSSYNGSWLPRYSYVAIINVGTDIDPKYEYYVTLRDSKRYQISLAKDDTIARNSIIRNDVSESLTSITPMCGDEEGQYMVISSIKGLEKLTPSNGWNATIYSSVEC